ncbi:hypothetical protein D3227_33785 [Mesorhizobium waimense]|uniref:SHOCT domain-containing protein n=1 Tax=Mesorhizobium waimense TaxID=1300307 RepID=A0A3A5K8J5_9HYPH|nr:hypothetical protein [Mesorhizobium waimense]RJT28618.1 hypothetical protein D3227_33785 [Mesorhizobium waimense]
MTVDHTEETLIDRIAVRHSISTDAVRAVLQALKSGGGRMAQFSHQEFGGMAQWSSGMTMVGDMFNDTLKAKLNAIATELAAYLSDNPQALVRTDEVSYRSVHPASAPWWPPEMGQPNSTGAQNDLRYAIFSNTRRLVIDDHGETTIYDTGEHHISGISQAQSSGSTLTFAGQDGLVRTSDLKKVRPPSS